MGPQNQNADNNGDSKGQADKISDGSKGSIGIGVTLEPRIWRHFVHGLILYER